MTNDIYPKQQLGRVALFLTITLSLLGLMSFFIMPREEDPRIQRRNAIFTIVLPGAGPEKIERLVIRPLEDELLKVEELKTIEVETRINVAVVKLILRDEIRNFSDAWREVDAALDRARKNLPSSVATPVLDFGVLDVESIVVALTGTDNLVTLIDQARVLKDSLLRNSQVAEVRVFGSPPLALQVDVDVQQMQSLGISVPQLLRGVGANNSAQSSGFVIQDSNRVLLAQDNDVDSEEAIEGIKFETGRLNNVKLGSFAKVERTTSQPAGVLFRWNGKKAVGVGIIPKEGVNIEAFGKDLTKYIDRLRPQFQPLQIEMVAYQPKRTHERINDLLLSLLSGMAMIATFLFLTTGAATALVVTVCVPLISLIGLFFYFSSGGILHQISISAFVISIGQFIDSIIVVVDMMQTKVKNGAKPEAAARDVTRLLRWPMAFATATGICAFLPMLAAQGSPADFIFSFPQVAILTLVTSYFVALFFTPLLAARVVTANPRILFPLPFEPLERVFTALALGAKWRILTLLGVMVSVSLVGLIMVKKDFFPESDRNEFVFAVELGPSADLSATNEVLQKIEELFQNDPRITDLAVFAGGDIPRFYYNLPNPKAAPESGHVLVTTQTTRDVKPVGLEMERAMAKIYPQARFTAQFLQQGPPIPAKVEINVFSEDRERRAILVNQVNGILKSHPMSRSVRPDALKGLQQAYFEAKDSGLADVGLTRDDLGNILSFYTSGVPVSQFRFDREMIPIVVRAQKGLSQKPETLLDAVAIRGRDRDFSIAKLTSFQLRDELPLLRRENGQTYSRVLSDLVPGFTFDQIVGDLRREIGKIPLKSHERIDFGGDSKAAGEANLSILKIVPVAMTLLILFLLIEFKSFRKVLIASLALPVALMGVFPGLWLGGAPFGFMSLLGILALVGIAINNIILLLEALESEGSLRQAIAARFRAIMLTTILTLLGLIPLAFSDSSLWPPLAWTMISGLITGTIATLIVVPGLYRLFFKATGATALVIAFFILATVSGAPQAQAIQAVTIDELLGGVSQSEEHRLTITGESSAQFANDRSWREAYAPKVTAGGELFKRNRKFQIATPFGALTQEDRNRMDVQLEVRQSLFDYGSMGPGRSASRLELKASEAQKAYQQKALRVQFGAQAIEVLILQREIQYIEDSIVNLRNRERDVRRLVDKGRLSKNDLLKIQIGLERLAHAKESIEIQQRSQKQELASALNISVDFQIIPPSLHVQALDLEPNFGTGDFENLDHQTEALEARKSQVLSAGLPVIDGFARVISTEGRNLVDEEWGEAGISLRWEIFGGGVRRAQAGELSVKKAAVASQKNLLKRDKQTFFAETEEQLFEGVRWMAKMENLKKKAVTSRRDEERRYFDGRGSLNDLVEADNTLLELQKESDVTALKLTVNCMQLKLWSGHEVRANCQAPSFENK